MDNIVLVTYLLLLNWSPSSSLQLEPGKIIIDTDAGADDAVAILLAASPHENRSVDIVAITCVNGNTRVDNVVNNVFKVLETLDRLEIPVFRGTTTSILATPPSDGYFGSDGFGDFEFKSSVNASSLVQKEHAVNALVRLVSESPGNVTILCLGPLTNVALASRLDPYFLSKVLHLIILGGSVEGLGNVAPGVEFNFFMDPEAGSIVLESAAEHSNPVILVPWETVCKRTSLKNEWRQKVLGALDSPQVRLMNLAERYQLQNNTEWACADAVAAAIALDSSLVLGSATLHASVECHGSLTRGAVLVDYKNTSNSANNVVIVEQLDRERYKSLLLHNLATPT